jgi:CRP-like cAMP-binding protein
VWTQTAPRLTEQLPWLLDFVPRERREWVRRNLVVPSLRLAVGPIAVDDLPQPKVGLLILDGLLVRRLDVSGHIGAELISRSDLLRPWTYDGPLAVVPAVDSFQALTELELAVLDEPFLRVAAAVPEVAVALIERSVERARTDAFFLAIRAVVRIEERLLLTLWHLAERYGKVTRDGVVLQLPRVSHDILAEMIGARRPSVTTALRGLEDRGLVERQGRGTWILKGDPQQALERLSEPV